MRRDAFYEDLLKPLLFQLDPEDAHDLVHQLLRMFGGVLPSLPYRYKGSDLQTDLAGRTLQNPVGIAAGFDKNGRLVDILGYLGFGFAEVGSVTAKATAGNPKPRLFRLPDDQALINRLGLNGDGADVVASRLRVCKPSLPLAVNIAKTHDPSIAGDKAIEDILHSFRAVRELDIIYVALNASCPNTREGCMKEKQELSTVLGEMQKINGKRIPLFVKVSPDSSPELVDDILEIGRDLHLAGYICGNTTLRRDGLKTSAEIITQIGNGGLSGSPLQPLALEMCRKFALGKQKDQAIIAVGGIASGADAYRFIRHGASAVEVYTGLIYKGPSLIREMCQELSGLLARDGITLKQAIGADLKN